MDKRKVTIGLTVLFAIVGISDDAGAGNSFFYKELNLIGGYSDKEEWIGKSSALMNSAGFEYYKKFSNEYGDYLTADLQARVAYDSLEDSEDAWGLEIHNAWLEYKVAYGINIKAGHFDPAFGLEPILDTHGTILQVLAARNIGFKKDWGAALKGFVGDFDYKIAAQLGSGMSIHRKDGSFLLTGRVGTPGSEDFQYGLSALYGDVLTTRGMKTIPRNDLVSDSATLKKRIGFDSQYLAGPLLFKGEVAYGTDGDEDVLGYLGEVDVTPPAYQNIQFELQLQSWYNDVDNSDSEDLTLTLGTSYKLGQNITVRAAYVHDFNRADGEEDKQALVQFYYYGL